MSRSLIPPALAFRRRAKEEFRQRITMCGSIFRSRNFSLYSAPFNCDKQLPFHPFSAPHAHQAVYRERLKVCLLEDKPLMWLLLLSETHHENERSADCRHSHTIITGWALTLVMASVFWNVTAPGTTLNPPAGPLFAAPPSPKCAPSSSSSSPRPPTPCSVNGRGGVISSV